MLHQLATIILLNIIGKYFDFHHLVKIYFIISMTRDIAWSSISFACVACFSLAYIPYLLEYVLSYVQSTTVSIIIWIHPWFSMILGESWTDKRRDLGLDPFLTQAQVSSLIASLYLLIPSKKIDENGLSGRLDHTCPFVFYKDIQRSNQKLM